MSIRPDTLALLDAFLGTEHTIDDLLEQLRNVFCDVVNAGDDLCTVENGEDPQYREAWQILGGDRAMREFDNLADLIRRTWDA